MGWVNDYLPFRKFMAYHIGVFREMPSIRKMKLEILQLETLASTLACFMKWEDNFKHNLIIWVN